MVASANRLAEAFAQHRSGDFARAERGYRAVLKDRPADPDALYLLGMLCLDCDRSKEAANHLQRAIANLTRTGRQADPGWHLALGTALQREGKAELALAAFDIAAQMAPDNIDVHFCRATALQDLGRFAEAAAAYEAVLAKAPNHAEALNNLGVIRRENGDPAGAAAAFRRAVAARSNYVEALCNLGKTLADAGHGDEAVPVLKAAAEARPDDVDLHLALFDCLIQADRADEVEARARKFLEINPDSAPIMAALGGALEFLGRKSEAATVFIRAIGIDPGCSRAQQGLADIREEAGKDTHIGSIRRALEEAGRDEAESAGLWFALARHLEAAGDDDGSLDAYLQANRLKCAGLAQRGYAYDRRALERMVDALIEAYPVGGKSVAATQKSELPVFVLGMPRSGTTLTEQILASHPMVHGAGELGLMGRIVGRLTQTAGYPGGEILQDALDAAAKFYLDAIGRLGGDAKRVTDKMPQNFMHIGLIAQMLPGARIVHCRRDPVDNCLSCFMQNFRAADLAWTCDLADLAHYYGQYRRIMDHWRRVLPEGRMLDVDYEDTVADLETQARRIVDFAGLPWDEACLDFHRSKRSVITASHSQVRQKIYTSSVGRWKRHGDALSPLIDGLRACTDVAQLPANR